MEKLAVLFPGAGYSLDAPLLYCGDFLLESKGYRRLPVNYQQPWESRLAQLAAQSDCTVFLSKSIGTVQAGKAAAKLGISPPPDLSDPRARDHPLYRAGQPCGHRHRRSRL